VDVAASEILTLVQENERLKVRCEKAERELKEALEVKRVSLSLVISPPHYDYFLIYLHMCS
jgi:hypothetical protein